MFSALSNWSLLSLLNKFGMSRLMATACVRLLKSAPSYCLVTIGDRKPETFLKGGEAMQRFWLKATSFGLSVQPMAAMPFLLNHYSHDKGAQFAPRHRRIIQDIHATYKQVVSEEPNELLFFSELASLNRRNFITEGEV